MFAIKINNKNYTVSNNELTVLQQCELYNLYIPRFCYHDRLSIAGNCRMCLVELETSIKPIIACSTSLIPNLSIFTNSKTVKKIRENILEFLLINHPLDCPICDQGGECDLQDQSMIFGSDRGRFHEIKRSVEDKSFGPFIKSIMTRCIHCTRCVRFFDEIVGLSVLGTLGRGRDTEIGTYISVNIINELSGNVIDLCPVGALTSKPYAFSARPWELTSIESIDIFDSLCSNIRIDIKGNTIMRILPKLNDLINEEWITDKIRFSYDGFRRERLTFPLIKVLKKNNLLFNYCSWSTIYDKIKFLFQFSTEAHIRIYGGSLIDLFSLYLFKHWFDSCILFISFYCDFYLQPNITSNFLMSTSITSISDCTSILFYNINLKEEVSVLNTRIRKLKWKLKDKFNISYIGKSSFFNYKTKHIGITSNSLIYILQGKHFICNLYFNSKLCIFTNNKFKSICNLFNNYISNAAVNSISSTIDTIHYNMLGFKTNKIDAIIYDFLIYFLLNYNKPLNLNINTINYIIYQGSHGNSNAMSANILLPSLSYTEVVGYYMNLEGYIQISDQVIYGPGISKSMTDIFLNILTHRYYSSFALRNKLLTNYFNNLFPIPYYQSKLILYNLETTTSIYNLVHNTQSNLQIDNYIIDNSIIYNARKKSKFFI